MSEKDRILVTGGAGYIGSHACKALAASGYEPIVYDNLSNGHDWAVKWGPLEEGDILDKDRLVDVLKQYQPEAVMHFAALMEVGESVRNPGKYYRNNLLGSVSLVQAMRDQGIKRLVFSSTAAVYGIPEAVPIKEDAPFQPINPYGSTKRLVEQVLNDFDRQYGLRSITLRYFNAAGADPEGEVGEAHDPETHLIPLVLDAVSGKRKKVTVFGEDYDTPDGTCIRDYIHVSDLADAHVLALKKLEKDDRSDVFNLGNGRGFSVREVIDSTEKITGKSVPFDVGKRRDGDPARLVADSSKARADLGWRPKHDDLKKIIETAWAWHERAETSSGSSVTDK